MGWDTRRGGGVAAQSAAIAGIADIARHRRDRKAKPLPTLKPTPNWDGVG
jgi:hypothetical protein